MSSDLVYLNNQFVNKEDAKISVFDRGFLFADGIYEVIPVYNGKAVFLNEHLTRLQGNLKQIKINYDVDFNEWTETCHKLIECNGPDRPIYIQITRGQDVTRLHNYPSNLKPTVVSLSLNPIKLGSSLEAQDISVITMPDVRWKLCHIKTISLLGNILLNQEAYDQGAKEALLINNKGNIIEGTSSNFFIVKDDQVITPVLNNEMLPGITRQIVIKICRDNSIKCIEQAVTINDLNTADEIWLTSSTREIRPVTKVNNKVISNGKPGPVWAKVAKLYIDFISNLTKK